MNTPEGHRIQQNSRSIFSESVLSTPSLQAPTPHSANDVDYPRYIPVDPFRNPRSHHYVSTTIDDIPVYPTPKALHTHYSNPTEPPHGVYTPPRSPPLRPEVIGSAERGRQPSSASRPTRLFTHAHDSLPMYHAHSASPSRRRNLIETITAHCRYWRHHLPALFMEALPRKCYVYLLLGLPEVYFARVSRVFKNAGMSMSEIKKMALEYPHGLRNDHILLSPWSPVRSHSGFVLSSYQDLQSSWNALVDALIKEWTSSSLASCIILCAILLILQKDVAGFDPVSRYLVLFSSIFCLLGLVYGCIYTLRFGVMRDAHRIAEWAFEAQKIRTHLLWNVWIFLSLPTAFLGWSFVLLICSILSVIWRTSSSGTVFSPVDSATSSGLRAFITVIFGLGVIYLMLILRMFRRFGEPMDEAWEDRIKAWNADKAQFQINAMNTQLATPAIPSLPLSPITRTYEEHTLPLTSLPSPIEPTQNTNDEQMMNQQESRPLSPLPDVNDTRVSSPSHDRASTLHDSVPVFLEVINVDRNSTSKYALRSFNSPYLQASTCKASKILDMRNHSRPLSPVPEPVVESGISTQDWKKFVTDMFTAWEFHGGFGHRPLSPGSSDDEAEDDIGGVLERWNASTFSSVGIQALLCQEFPCGLSDDHPQVFAIYIIEYDRSIPLAERFGAVPDGLCRIDICDPLIRHLRTSLLPNSKSARGCSDSSLSLEVVDD